MQDQITIIESIIDSIVQINNSNQSINNRITSQTEILKGINDTLSKVTDLINGNSRIQDKIKTIDKIKSNSDESNIFNAIKIFLKRRLLKSKNTLENINSVSEENVSSIKESSQQFSKLMKKLLNTEEQKNSELDKKIKILESKIENKSFITKKIAELGGKIKEEILGIFSSGVNPFAIIMKLFFTLIRTMFSLLTSMVGAIIQMHKMIMTLPFTVLEFANKVGHNLRVIFIENIGGTFEELKENIDMGSYLGENASHLKSQVSGSVKDFEFASSNLSRLFGHENPQEVLKQANEIIKGIGTFAQIFGKQVLDIKSVEYMTRAQKYLMLSYEDFKYFAMTAYIQDNKSIFDPIYDVIMSIEDFSKQTGYDTKNIGRIFKKMRLDVIEFGHLSNKEILRATEKLIKYNVSADDAVNVFKNFSTYENAASNSAKLFQSFGMVVDAFDMVTAKDPAEMIMTLRNAMFATGKQFSDLDRHSIAYMKSITNISEQSLASLFSFESMSMSQSELKSKLSNDLPVNIQTKAIRELTSAVKQIKKVLDFNDPFEAIFKGLYANASLHRDMVNATTEYTELLEKINFSFSMIDPSIVRHFARILNRVIRSFTSNIKNGKFMNMFVNMTKTISEFVKGLFLLSFKDNTFLLLDRYQRMLDETKGISEEKINKSNETLASYFNVDSNKEFFEVLKLNKDNLNFNSFITSLNENYTNLNKQQKSIAKSILSKINEQQDDSNKSLNFSKELENHKVFDIATLTENLFIGLKNVFKEGSVIYQTIFNIGKEIATGFIKSFMMVSTSMMHLINGQTKKAIDSMPGIIDGLMGDNVIFKLFGITTDEFNKLRNDLTGAVTQLFKDNIVNGNLWGIFTILIDTIWDVSSEIFDIIYTVAIDSLSNLSGFNKLLLRLGTDKKTYTQTQIAKGDASKSLKYTDVLSSQMDSIVNLSRTLGYNTNSKRQTFFENKYTGLISGDIGGDNFKINKDNIKVEDFNYSTGNKKNELFNYINKSLGDFVETLAVLIRKIKEVQEEKLTGNKKVLLSLLEEQMFNNLKFTHENLKKLDQNKLETVYKNIIGGMINDVSFTSAFSEEFYPYVLENYKENNVIDTQLGDYLSKLNETLDITKANDMSSNVIRVNDADDVEVIASKEKGFLFKIYDMLYDKFIENKNAIINNLNNNNNFNKNYEQNEIENIKKTVELIKNSIDDIFNIDNRIIVEKTKI